MESVQDVPVPLERVWGFFADPRSLDRLSPPWVFFEAPSPLPPCLSAGLVMTLAFRPLFGMRVRWVAEITCLEPPRLFVDEQRAGPFRAWRHEHRFAEIPGGSRVHDLVTYSLPFGLLGLLADRLLVRPRLARIFAHRRDVLRRMFDNGAKRAIL